MKIGAVFQWRLRLRAVEGAPHSGESVSSCDRSVTGGADLAIDVSVGAGRLALQEQQSEGQREKPEIAHK
jgi:hypothetical protein